MTKEEGRPPRDWPFILGVAALVVALLSLVWLNQEKHEKIQQAILSQAKAISLEEGAARELASSIYERARKAIEEELPRIVCLGDEYTTGNQKGSFPSQLGRLIAQELFGKLNERLNPLVRQMNRTSLKLPVLNQGVVGEPMALCLARFGGEEVFLYRDLVLSSRGDPAVFDLADSKGEKVLLSRQPFSHVGKIQVGDLEGRLYFTADLVDSLHYQAAFRPESAPGQEVRIPAGTRVLFESAGEYLEDVAIFFFGNNILTNGAVRPSKEPMNEEEIKRYVEGIREIIGKRPDAKPYLVLGRAKEGDLLDQAYREAFGDHYLCIGEKELEVMGLDDMAAIARQAYERLEEQHCFEGLRAILEEGLTRAQEGGL